MSRAFYLGGSFGAAIGGLAWTIRGLGRLRRHGLGDADGDGGASCCSPGRAPYRLRPAERQSSRLDLSPRSRARAARSRAPAPSRIDGGVSTSTSMPRGRGFCFRISCGCPPQQPVAANGEGFPIECNHRAIRQCVELAPMHALGFTVQAVRRAGSHPSTGADARIFLPENNDAKCSASLRRHSKHGRWPAARAVTSSRKNNSV